MIPPHLVWMKEVLDLALDVLQRLKPAVRRDEGDQSEDHDAHKHPRQRAAGSPGASAEPGLASGLAAISEAPPHAAQ